MQDLAHRGDAAGVDEARPKVFADVLDGIHAKSIDAKRGNEVANPGLEGKDDLWRLSVQVRGMIGEPACVKGRR